MPTNNDQPRKIQVTGRKTTPQTTGYVPSDFWTEAVREDDSTRPTIYIIYLVNMFTDFLERFPARESEDHTAPKTLQEAEIIAKTLLTGLVEKNIPQAEKTQVLIYKHMPVLRTGFRQKHGY